MSWFTGFLQLLKLLVFLPGFITHTSKNVLEEYTEEESNPQGWKVTRKGLLKIKISKIWVSKITLGSYYWNLYMIVLWLKVLLFYFQPMQTKPKSSWWGKYKAPHHWKHTDIFLAYKRLPISTRAHSLGKRKGANNLYSDGGYLGWTNLTGQFRHINIEFSIIKYSLNISGNGN